MTLDAYAEAVGSLSSQPDSVTDVAHSFTRLFPVSGASVSTLGDFLGNETLSASSAFAARLDELQFDLGEGPCWDALSTKRPVLEPDLRGLPDGRWPAFSAAVHSDVGAIFAFPMTVGQLRIGAVDLYAESATEFEPRDAQRAAQLAGMVGRAILSIAVAGTGEDPAAAIDTRYSRRAIHQATGMVLAQLDISAEEASLVIRGHAFATDTSMMTVADDILTGRLTFGTGADGIEETR